MAAINGQKDHQRNQLFLVDKSGKKDKNEAKLQQVPATQISSFAKIESSVLEILWVRNKRKSLNLHAKIQ